VIVEYIKIVVEDYINHISPLLFKFVADPSAAWNAPWNKPNWITTEFSLLYRWHSLIPDEITWNGTPIPVGKTFFDNSLLFKSSMADAFVSLSQQKASKLGAFNTADALLPFEVRSIRQGRICRLQPYVAYKKFVSEEPPASFEEMNPDPEVSAKLKELYGSIDRVDFHVGLFCEPVSNDSPCPQLLGTMVAIDAFSQALTNPLLSQYVFNEATFSAVGWAIINETDKLEQIVQRNCPGLDGRQVTFTQPTWVHSLSLDLP
jgi:prostaglandin-endoperoxide synthase 2